MTITMAMGNAQALKVDEYEGATVVDGTGYADTRHIGDFPSTVLYSYGLVNGTATDEDGNVDMSLDSTLTRQEATTLLVRLLGGRRGCAGQRVHRAFYRCGTVGQALCGICL